MTLWSSRPPAQPRPAAAAQSDLFHYTPPQKQLWKILKLRGTDEQRRAADGVHGTYYSTSTSHYIIIVCGGVGMI